MRGRRKLEEIRGRGNGGARRGRKVRSRSVEECINKRIPVAENTECLLFVSFSRSGKLREKQSSLPKFKVVPKRRARSREGAEEGEGRGRGRRAKHNGAIRFRRGTDRPADCLSAVLKRSRRFSRFASAQEVDAHFLPAGNFSSREYSFSE